MSILFSLTRDLALVLLYQYIVQEVSPDAGDNDFRG